MSPDREPDRNDRDSDHLGIVRFAALPAVPWRIGGGVTREVEGERMDLVVDGASQTSCSLPAGPTRDLNVMTRGDRLSAAVAEPWSDPDPAGFGQFADPGRNLVIA